MIVCISLKSINNTNQGTIDHSINKETSDEIANDNMMNLKDNDVFDFKTLCNLRKDRLVKVLNEKYYYNTSIKNGQRFLFQHVNSKVNLVIMYADLVGSTKMSMTLSAEQLVTVVRAFCHELSSVIESYGGFVLKYVGDAIISFFPSEFNKYLVCDKTYRCAKSMIRILCDDVNPIFRKYSYPDLQVKIGLAEGENVVIQFGKDESSQIDLIGYIMNVASKITSISKPNKISVGGTFYSLLHPSTQSKFERVYLDETNWKYIDKHNDKPYKVYTTR